MSDHQTKPSNVVVSLPTDTVVVGGKTPYRFDEFIEFLVDNDPRFQRPAANARAGQRMLDSLGQALTGGSSTWLLQPNDWNLLTVVAEDPACGYARFEERDARGNKRGDIHVPTRILLPYIDAIQRASEKQLSERSNGARGVNDDGVCAQITQGETTCPAE